MAGRSQDGAGLLAVTAAALLRTVAEPGERGDLAVDRAFGCVAVLRHAQRQAPECEAWPAGKLGLSWSCAAFVPGKKHLFWGGDDVHKMGAHTKTVLLFAFGRRRVYSHLF